MYQRLYWRHIHSLPLIYWPSHMVIEDKVGHAGPAFPKALLVGPDPPVVLCMMHDDTQDDILPHIPKHWQTDRLGAPSVLLLALLVDVGNTGQPPVKLGPPCTGRTSDKWWSMAQWVLSPAPLVASGGSILVPQVWEWAIRSLFFSSWTVEPSFYSPSLSSSSGGWVP